MIRALLLIFVGAAAFAAVYFLMPPRETPRPVSETTAEPQGAPPRETESASLAQDTSTAMTFELRPGVEAANPNSEAPRLVRDVTPDTMTAGPRVTGTVTRVEPSPSAARQNGSRLFNPIIIAAGVIKVRDREIHLIGIEAPEFSRMCGTGAAAWPCGRLARAALRAFVHSRAIDCEIPSGMDKIPHPAKCLVGGDDMSEWLVAQGWAKPSGADFADAEKKAEKAKLGLWSNSRPDTQVATTGD